MSKTNYHEFSRKSTPYSEEPKSPPDVTAVAETTEPETDMRDVQTTTKPENVQEGSIPEPETTKSEPEETELLVTGTVVRCSLLNIRKMPNFNSEVLCVIPVGTKISVDTKESTNAWYKVCLDNGNFGYCMKNYITVE